MTSDELQALFETHDDKYTKFEEYVKNPLSKRPDLHAFLLLDKLVPGDRDIISASEHDEFYIDIDLEELAEKITEEQVIELIACGAIYSSEYDCLYMIS